MPVTFDGNAFVNRTYKALNKGRVVAVNTSNVVGKAKGYINGVVSGVCGVLMAVIAWVFLVDYIKKRKQEGRPPLRVSGFFALGASLMGACAAYSIWTARSQSPYAVYQRRMSGAQTTAMAAGDIWDAFVE